MKSVIQDDNNASSDDNAGVNSQDNWLGFSLLYPHRHHQTQQQFNNPPGLFYEFGESGGGFHPSSSVMSLNSNGSACLMESLTTPQQHPQQGVVPNSSPKLEDFLGMESHHRQYGSHGKEEMFFHHQTPLHPQEQQQPSSSEDQFLLQHSQYFSGHEIYQETPVLYEEEATNGEEGERRLLLDCETSPLLQSSCATAPSLISQIGTEAVVEVAKKRGSSSLGQKQALHRKSLDTFGQRTSHYRGVTRHRWTGRYEAHLWDNSCRKEGQTRKGRQVYLGGYDSEEKAARAYDLAALKYWGVSSHINFPLENYKDDLEDMKNMTRQEYVAHLRRRSSGFSRGASIYRGVTRHHQHGRWQARIGRVAGNKDLYLGTFSTQEEAGEAYDIAAIKFRGANAVTNFDISRYHVERIMASDALLSGNLAKRGEEIQPTNEAIRRGVQSESNMNEDVSADPQSLSVGNCEDSMFSMALHDDHIGTDSGQHSTEKSAKMGPQFSNASSLVTSLNSSREGSPQKSGPWALFSPYGSKFIDSGATNNSWIPSAAAAAAISIAQLPVFAAWNDA